MSVTLEQVIERAVRETGLGWSGSVTSLTASTVGDTAAEANTLGADAWKGAYLFRPDAASAVDYNRRISAFSPSNGVFSHDGADYADTTITSEQYMICPWYPGTDWIGVGFSWQRAVNRVLEKLPTQVIRDGHTLNAHERSWVSLAGLSGVNRRSQIRSVWRRRPMGEVLLDITLAENMTASESDMDVSDGTAVMVNDVLRCDNEDYLVRGISTNTLTVTPAYFGTTAAAHTSGATLSRVEYHDYRANTQGMDWRWRGGVNSSGVDSYGLFFLPPINDTEQVVVEYVANWTALTTPASTTEAPIEVLAAGAVHECLKVMGPAKAMEAAQWQRRYQETLLSWMPGAVIREP